MLIPRKRTIPTNLNPFRFSIGGIFFLFFVAALFFSFTPKSVVFTVGILSGLALIVFTLFGTVATLSACFHQHDSLLVHTCYARMCDDLNRFFPVTIMVTYSWIFMLSRMTVHGFWWCYTEAELEKSGYQNFLLILWTTHITVIIFFLIVFLSHIWRYGWKSVCQWFQMGFLLIGLLAIGRLPLMIMSFLVRQGLSV